MRTDVRIITAALAAWAQLSWLTCWAADPPAECKADLTEDEISVSITADTEDEKLAEILGKIEKKLPDAFAIPRSKELKGIVSGITQELIEREGVNVADISAGIVAGCTALHGQPSQPFDAAVAAAFQAARLPVPETVSAEFATTGSDETGSKYAFMTGIVNSLEADGSWKASVEASLVSRTQFFGEPLRSPTGREQEGTISNLMDPAELKEIVTRARGFGRFEVTYSGIGKLDDEQSSGVPNTNPFAAGGGILRLNLGPEVVTGQGWWGATAGFGLTTQPTDTEDADVDARRRWYAGLLFLADYGSSKENAEHVTGRVALGYSDDKFWEWTQTVEENGMTIVRERDESKRWFLDARIDGPGVFQSKSVKLSLRMYVDHPKSGDGPTDVRVSLLVTADLGLLFGS